ncbi:MAG: hypothetical protein R3F14_41870 [Polyangiaceae bacterium]
MSRLACSALALTSLLALSSGCDQPVPPGDTSPGGTGGGGTTGGAGGSTTTTEEGTETLVAQMGPITIASGEEAVKCVTVSLGNPDPVFVRRFRTTLHEGSHHMIVYTTDQPPNATPVACQSFGVAGGSAIFIAQQPESELVFPNDPSGVPVGLPLHADQSLVIEIHYINTTPSPLDVLGAIEMDVLPVAADVIKSGFAFQGAFGIPEIPAQGEADTGVLWQPGLPGANLFALTTHQHQLGTRMQVWYADDTTDLSTPIADSTSWHDPPLETFDPPLHFPLDGSKGFAYQCHWVNPTSQTVYGGLGAEDEMCFFWSYYYPAPN